MNYFKALVVVAILGCGCSAGNRVPLHTVLSKRLDMSKDWIGPCVHAVQTHTLTCMTNEELEELALKNNWEIQ